MGFGLKEGILSASVLLTLTGCDSPHRTEPRQDAGMPDAATNIKEQCRAKALEAWENIIQSMDPHSQNGHKIAAMAARRAEKYCLDQKNRNNAGK